jgi:hypothetical protein
MLAAIAAVKMNLGAFRVVVSFDGGATWFLARIAPTASAGGLYTSGTQLLYADAQTFAVSSPCGLPPLLSY